MNISKQVIQDFFYVFFEVYFVKYIFDGIQLGVEFSKTFTLLCMMIFGQIFIHLISTVYDYYMLRNNPIIFKHIYSLVLKKSKKIPFECFEDYNFYNKYSRTLDSAQSSAEIVLNELSALLGQIVRLITIIIISIKWDAFIAFFALFPIIINIFFTNVCSKMVEKRNKDLIPLQRKVKYFCNIFFDKKYAEEIRIYNLKSIFINRYKDTTRKIKETYKRYFFKTILYNYIKIFNSRVLLLISVVVYLTYKMLKYNSYSLGEYMCLLTAVNTIMWSLDGIISHYGNLNEEEHKINDLFNFFSEVCESNNDKRIDNIPKELEKIAFENVSFKYPGSNEWTIKNINLTFEKGERIAIVGENGAGKSTFIKLLMKLYKPNLGKICYNGININNIDSEFYYNKISVVFQDFKIYALSIAENILMREVTNGNDEERVKRALDKVGLLDKVMCHPKGIYAIITKEFDEMGVVFSLGEMQKIVIARIIANEEAEILILDEPSSALDPISEYELFLTLSDISNFKLLIYISHRLSLARFSDKIIYIHNGSVIESGTHDDLIYQRGEYYHMYKLQEKMFLDLDTTHMK